MSSPVPTPTPRGRAGLLWALVAAGGVAALGVLLAVLVTLILSLVEGGSGEDADPYTSEWPPTADCGQPCFTLDEAYTLAPDDAALALLGSPARTSAIAQLGDDWTVESEAFGEYYLADGDPQSCIFATTPAPLAPQTQSTGWAKNPIVDLGAASNRDITVTQMARVYLQNLDAQRYPTMIASVLARCDQFTIEENGAPVTVDVAPLEWDSGVTGVESVAWTETWPDRTSTVVDLRYGTIVVRTEITRPAGSAVTDAQLADFIRTTAERLAALG